jgi:hypothetical protein
MEAKALRSGLRAKETIIKNPYDGNPSIAFNEEVMIHIGGIPKILETGTVLEVNHYNLEKVLVLRHPLTGQVVRETTYAEFQMFVYSVYIGEVAERDGLDLDVALI